jgi:hypothetical protein
MQINSGLELNSQDLSSQLILEPGKTKRPSYDVLPLQHNPCSHHLVAVPLVHPKRILLFLRHDGKSETVESVTRPIYYGSILARPGLNPPI